MKRKIKKSETQRIDGKTRWCFKIIQKDDILLY